jgi:hypothetical protein
MNDLEELTRLTDTADRRDRSSARFFYALLWIQLIGVAATLLLIVIGLLYYAC